MGRRLTEKELRERGRCIACRTRKAQGELCPRCQKELNQYYDYMEDRACSPEGIADSYGRCEAPCPAFTRDR
jgi:hypothetical protein